MDIMQDVDRASAEFYHPGVGITFRPVSGIDIPSDRYHGRDSAQLGDDLRPTDIAGVDDLRYSGEALHSLWT